MRTYTSESTVSPPYIDADSSKTLTYVNTNIRQIERIDEVSGDVQMLFAYSVTEYTKPEWEQEKTRQLSEVSTQQDAILIGQYEAQVTQDSAILDLYERIGGVINVH